jgi:hypothetical protein
MKIKLGEGIRQEKQFFFEKKNQKTFPARSAASPRRFAP